MSEIPIAFLHYQINADYYKYHKTLNEVIKKYDRYSEDEIKQVLGVYDLDKVEVQPYSFNWFTERLKREWEDACRRLNPRAWYGR